MVELQERLEKVSLRLDLMGMRVEQALGDALDAVRRGDADAGKRVDRDDAAIDREEVQIEQECIRLLALYQPAAIDLRTICTVIKVNSDLERIADLAASIGRRAKHVVQDDVDLGKYDGFEVLARAVTDILGRTVRAMRAPHVVAAKGVIEADHDIDAAYGCLVRDILDTEGAKVGGAETTMTLMNIAKALERVGDLCTNIAEDIIFLRTGDIIRHSSAFAQEPND